MDCPGSKTGRILHVANVIWATGYRPGYSWIDLPVLDEDGYPIHKREIAVDQPGIAFVGFPFVHSASSGMVHGLWRDARYVASRIAARTSERQPDNQLRVNRNTAPAN